MMTRVWTPRAAAARSRRKLKAVKTYLEKIAIEIGGEWGDEKAR
jgi:hypothetical protein